MFKFTNELNNNLEDKKIAILIFFNKKAFDSLESNTLLRAIKECDVRKLHSLNKQFSDYLTARSYRVKVKDT